MANRLPIAFGSARGFGFGLMTQDGSELANRLSHVHLKNQAQRAFVEVNSKLEEWHSQSFGGPEWPHRSSTPDESQSAIAAGVAVAQESISHRHDIKDLAERDLLFKEIPFFTRSFLQDFSTKKW